MLLGLDTSRWEDNPSTPETIDWNKAKSSGVSFVIMKATEGISYVDPVYALHKKNSAGVLYRGSYHYWRPMFTAKAQAEFYFKVAGNTEMPPALDVEDYYSELPKGATLEKKIIEQLEAIDEIFGRECMLYTSPNILRNYLSLSPTSPLLKRKLWIANYGVSTPDARPFSRWTLWQFSERGSAAKYGISEASAVDENWYNGTLEEFENELVKGGSVVIPPVITSPTGIYMIMDDLQVLATNPTLRPMLRKGLPSTQRMYGGDGSSLLPEKWMSYVYEINKPFENYQFDGPNALVPAKGWHNQGDPNRVEHVTFSGNIVDVYRFDGDKAFIRTVSIAQNPPNVYVKPTEGSLHSLIQMFTTQYADRLDMTTGGRRPRTILASNPGEELWIPKGVLFQYTQKHYLAIAKALPWLNIRSWPSTSANIRGRKLYGSKIPVYGYAKFGENIWGRIAEGWIALKYNGQYFTDWKL